MLLNWAKKAFDLHIFVIAHPRKMPKEGGQYEAPGLYDISGSSDFANTADWGISIYKKQYDDIGQEVDNPLNIVHIIKQKYSYLSLGAKTINFEINLECLRMTPKFGEGSSIDSSNWITREHEKKVVVPIVEDDIFG